MRDALKEKAVADGSSAFQKTREYVIRLFSNAHQGAWCNVVSSAADIAGVPLAAPHKDHLISSGADSSTLPGPVRHVLLSCRDGRKWSTLHFAAAGGNVAVVEQLLKLDPELSKAKDSEEGVTPLMLAARHAHLTVCQKLLETVPSCITARADDGRTPLHFAIQGKNAQCLELLLSSGAKVDAKADTIGTPIYWSITMALGSACCAGGKSVSLQKEDMTLIACLLKYHPNVSDTPEGIPPLLVLASSFGNAELVKLLLDAGACLGGRDPEGFNALQIAAEAGHLEVVQLLLDHCQRVSPELLHYENKGRTALDLALESQHDAVASLLRSFRVPTAQKRSSTAGSTATSDSRGALTPRASASSATNTLPSASDASASLTDEEGEEQRRNERASPAVPAWSAQQKRLVDAKKDAGNRKADRQEYGDALQLYRDAYALCYPCKESRAPRSVLESNMSFVLLRLGCLEEALQAAQRAIRLQPSWFKGYLRASHVYEAMKNWEEAAQTMWEAATRAPASEKNALKDAFLRLMAFAKEEYQKKNAHVSQGS